jgi:hypothetical protein
VLVVVVPLFVMVLVVAAAPGIVHAGVATAEKGHAADEGTGGEDELSNLGHARSDCNQGAADALRARKES